MAPIDRPQGASPALAQLLDAAAEVYAVLGDPSSMAIAGKPGLAGEPAARPPALRDLARAMEAMPPGPLAGPIRDCAAHLPWTDRVFPMPDKLAGRNAFVEIVGPGGLARRDDLRFGLYLQSPATFYPAHSHAAEERYYVVSGTAMWQKDDGAFRAMTPGTMIHHASWERHAMETGREALLAMWLWTGDLDPASFRIDGA